MSWFTRTLRSADAAHLLHQTTSSLLPSIAKESPLLLFCLSKNIPASTLSSLVSSFQSCTPSNLGFLSSDGTSSQSIAARSPSQKEKEEYHVSIAAAPPSLRAVPFRSTLRGKPTIALGRELRPDLLKQREVTSQGQQGGLADHEAAFFQNAQENWHELWGSTNHVHTLPKELQSVNSDHVSDLIYFSDTAPQALFSTLDHYFPSSRQLGILASSTPFVTGRPFTIIQSSSIHSDGAVGFALINSQPSTQPQSQAAPQLSMAGWKPVGIPSIVSRAQGNIILALDDDVPPTRVLVDNLEKAKGEILPVNKESEYFLGIVDQDRAPWHPESAKMLARVISGDPRKGGMAIDCEESFQPGMLVQFYAPAEPRSTPKAHTPGILCAQSVSDTDEDVFCAPSEHGFVVKQDATSASWLCSVPKASLSYPL